MKNSGLKRNLAAAPRRELMAVAEAARALLPYLTKVSPADMAGPMRHSEHFQAIARLHECLKALDAVVLAKPREDKPKE